MTEYGNIPPELHAEYDRHMAQKSVRYRGYSIKPASYAFQGYYVEGRSYYWGYTLCDAKGILNMAPGATAFFTLDQVKEAIDCIHLAGGHRKDYRDKSWVKTYWELMHGTTRFAKVLMPRLLGL